MWNFQKADFEPYSYGKKYTSGVTLLEGARGQGMAGCPLIKKRLRKVKQIEARNTREPCCMGSRGLLKGPGEINNRLTGWVFAHLVNYFAHPVNSSCPLPITAHPVTGPSEAVLHGGGRRTKILQGERERKGREGRKRKEKEGKEKREEKKGKKGRGEQERKMYHPDVLGLWV